MDSERRDLEEAFRRHRDELYRTALSYLRVPQDAEDVVQCTMARALAAIAEHRPRRLRPWLMAIARNEALMMLRDRVPQEVLGGELQAAGSVDGEVMLREEFAGVLADLRDLPERQRSALVLRAVHELDYRDIARVLEIGSGAARQAVYQARNALAARADGRAQDCATVRIMLRADGRSRRALSVRAHTAVCPSCHELQRTTSLAARIRSFLPPPDSWLPPVAVRLLAGPAASVRVTGSAAVLAALALGLSLGDPPTRDAAPERPGGAELYASADTAGTSAAPAPRRELTSTRRRAAQRNQRRRAVRRAPAPRGGARPPGPTTATAPANSPAPVQAQGAEPPPLEPKKVTRIDVVVLDRHAYVETDQVSPPAISGQTAALAGESAPGPMVDLP